MREDVPQSKRQLAKTLRSNSTDAERRMWSKLRAGRLEGLKFRRQVPHLGYILDFVCFEKKLVVELDGSQHSGSVSDRLRDSAMAQDGFLTLRFWNNEVLANTEGVLRTIIDVCRDR